VFFRSREARLVARCANGDRNAWAQFIKIYSDLLYRVIASVCARANPPVSQDTVEDICQSFYLSLMENDFRKLKRYRETSRASFEAWLRVVAANYARDFLRKRGRELSHRVQLPYTSAKGAEERDPMEEVLDPGVTPAEAVGLKEIVDFLRECLDKLPPADRLLLVLILDGQSDQYIARVMNITVQAVYMRKSRLRKKLEKMARERGLLERLP